MFQIKYVYDLVDKISPQLKKIQSNLKNTANHVKTSANSMARSFEKVSQKLQNIGKKAGQIGKNLFIKATLPIALLGASFVKTASDYQESINKVDVAFGSASKSVKSFADTAGKNFGIDRGSALDMAAMFGDMATGMGLSQDQAARMSNTLVGLSGDMSSFKNQSVSIMKTALASVFTGETESLKKLGTVMTEANLKEYARSVGITKNIKNMKQAEKVALRYAYVLKTQANALGDYKRTQEGFANQLRGLGTAWTDLSIMLGNILLPYALKLVIALKSLVEKFQALSPKTQKLILLVTGLVAVLGPILILISLMIPAVALLAKGFAFFSSVILANPIIAFIAAMVLLYKTWDDFRTVVDWVANAIANLFKGGMFDPFINDIKSIWNWINKIIDLGKIFDFGNFFSNAKIIVDAGVDKINDKLDAKAGINQDFTNINQQQQVTAGGQMDININGLPKGSSTNFTPKPKSFMNTYTNTTYAGS